MNKQVISDRNNNCLAIVLRSGRPTSLKSIRAVNFITDTKDYLQLAHMVRNARDTIPRHYHNPVKREIIGTGEVLFIVSGILSITLYDDNQVEVKTIKLFEGDAVVLLRGGHSMVMETAVEMYEVKQGPYLGVEDKTYF